LNVLLHHFEYQIDVSIRIRKVDIETGKKKLEVLKRVTKAVYATTNKIRMDMSKAEEVQLTYPILYFAIDDFHEIWKDISLDGEGQLVCVELFGCGDYFSPGSPGIRTRLFAGALDYETIRKEYLSKKWVWSSATESHFFNLKGPNGKGAAQMAVAAQDQPSTPGSWSRLGNAFKRMSGGSTMPDNPILKCSLTFLNMPWDVLLTDIINTFTKQCN